MTANQHGAGFTDINIPQNAAGETHGTLQARVTSDLTAFWRRFPANLIRTNGRNPKPDAPVMGNRRQMGAKRRNSTAPGTLIISYKIHA